VAVPKSMAARLLQRIGPHTEIEIVG
jgi:hypothetical protein